MNAAADSTNSVLSDEQISLYLYHSLPTERKSELTVWKGSRKYIPYEDLSRNIETKVQNELARNRYILKQGTPESRETRAETAMQAVALDQVLMPTPPKMDAALVSSIKCTHCYRNNHDTVDCYTLHRLLHNGQVKAGAVLPANFKLNTPHQPQPPQRQHPYNGSYNGKGEHQSRNNNKGQLNGNRGNHGKPQGRNKFHDRRNRDNDNDYGIVVITTLDLSPETEEVSLTARESDHDPMWTVDSVWRSR
ncbi:hypothetical protein PR003_g10769 [Phytophthora rubi]|uniref:Uncharacterized protein n=1 Tax=Phytophthora rubi TaxID=129364 RepID=A0A6A3MLZ2_9STRA|nr:hypothetical protein PR002_g22653 [Phytophthora rubi]KAE9033862.1 hypothetical protein PR001_g9968 [Phytophthora rubi]KAE9339906.1 hypothetical protein PR003_g10769 [Phytophthora rubi]